MRETRGPLIPVIQIHAKNVIWITVHEKTEKTKKYVEKSMQN